MKNNIGNAGVTRDHTFVAALKKVLSTTVPAAKGVG